MKSSISAVVFLILPIIFSSTFGISNHVISKLGQFCVRNQYQYISILQSFDFMSNKNHRKLMEFDLRVKTISNLTNLHSKDFAIIFYFPNKNNYDDWMKLSQRKVKMSLIVTQMDYLSNLTNILSPILLT